MAGEIRIPDSPVLGKDGKFNPEWLLWILNPQVQGITAATITGGSAALAPGLATSSGGTGSTVTPEANQIALGNGSAYVPSSSLPDAVLSNVGTPGTYGDSTHIVVIVTDIHGRVTSATATAITGSPGSFTVTTAFGCNGKPAQTSFASGGAVAGTGATNAAPWGYTTQAQADGIVTLLNNIRTALVNAGIMS